MPCTLQNILFDIGLLSMSSGRWLTHSLTAAAIWSSDQLFLLGFCLVPSGVTKWVISLLPFFSILSSLEWLSAVTTTEIPRLFLGGDWTTCLVPLFFVSSRLRSLSDSVSLLFPSHFCFLCLLSFPFAVSSFVKTSLPLQYPFSLCACVLPSLLLFATILLLFR